MPHNESVNLALEYCKIIEAVMLFAAMFCIQAEVEQENTINAQLYTNPTPGRANLRARILHPPLHDCLDLSRSHDHLGHAIGII